MRSINVLVLTGNLVADPELRHGNNGAPLSVLRVANHVRRKRGEHWMEKVSFFDVEVWGAQATACAEHLAKGSRVVVQGEIEIDEWADREGARRSKPVIRGATIGFEGGRARDARVAGSVTSAPEEVGAVPMASGLARLRQSG